MRNRDYLMLAAGLLLGGLLANVIWLLALVGAL